MWQPKVCVLLMSGDVELRSTVRVLFDPQCSENLISTSFLQTAFPLFTYNESTGVPIGTSLTGAPISSIATIEIRWTGFNHRERRSQYGPTFQPRFESSICRVVESDRFNLIIGSRAIENLALFKRNKVAIAAVRSPRNEKAVSEVRTAIRSTYTNVDGTSPVLCPFVSH